MRFTSTIVDLAVVLALAASADAFWRLECHYRSGLARMDPLVDPGRISPHLHTIAGGNNFNLNVKPKDLLDSQCSSCSVAQDKSAYWTPALFFEGTDGSFELVEQAMPLLVYYFLVGENLEPFPDDFQMLAGDTAQREFPYPLVDPVKPWSGEMGEQKSLAAHAAGFNCLNDSPGLTPEPTLSRHNLPNKTFMDTNCKNGLRVELSFPSCWDGQKFDLTSQSDHLVYPDQIFTGNCPKGYDRRFPSLLYETKWATNDFKDKEGRFVFSNGDPTGFGYHGDFMAAWDDGVLKQAISQCTSESGIMSDCKVFDIKQQTCEFEVPEELKGESFDGPLKSLPGNAPIVSSGYAEEEAEGDTAGYENDSASDTGAGDAKEEESPPVKEAESDSDKETPVSPPPADEDSPEPADLGANFAEEKVAYPAPPGTSTVAGNSPPIITDKPSEPSSVASDSDFRTVWTTIGQEVHKILVVDETVTTTVGVAPVPGEHARHKRAHERHVRRHIHDHDRMQ
ncbi:MAG: hypothetical protein M1837_000982 [Sclerophora amabilis]|nr:MAG: hypothetical protein M1837_000982 [Sclerophora amabilis]